MRTKWFRAALALLLVVASALVPCVPGLCAPDSWQLKVANGPECNECNQMTACIGPNGKTYVVAGGNQAVYEYDPATNSWSQLGYFGYAIHRDAGLAATADGKLYHFGGGYWNTGGDVNYTDYSFDIYEFDLATRQSRYVRAMHDDLGNVAVATATNGKIYVIGGIANGSPQWKDDFKQDIYEFDPATGSWTFKTTVESGAGCRAVGYPDGKVYIYGGRTSYDTFVPGRMKAYDPATNTITYYSGGHPQVYGHTMAVGGDGWIYLYGGWSPTGSSLKSIGAFNPVTGAWKSVPDCSSPSQYQVLASGGDGRVYLQEAYPYTPYYRATWQYTPPYPSPAGAPGLTPTLTSVTVNIPSPPICAGTVQLQVSADGSTWQGLAEWRVGKIPPMPNLVPPSQYVHGGLTPNARRWYRIAWGWTGELAAGQAASCYTLANPPASGSVSGSTQTSVAASWGANGNPSGTEYLAELRTIDGSVVQSTGWVANKLSHTFSGVSPGTLYRVYAKARNGDGVETSWLHVGECWTVPATPAAPSGILTGLAWSSTAGRGRVQLSWSPVSGATGYKVWVFDGNAYQAFDVGDVTSWDSQLERIYPSETWLDAQADNSVTSDPFNHIRGGEDLRDDPNKLYRKTAGSQYDSAHNYWFRVSAYNASGESPQSNAYMPTLPNRTDPVAPSGTLRINDGAAVTGSISVTLQPQGSDSGGSGLGWMQFSNDNSVWSAWYPYSASYSGWSLAPGEGTKTVYVRFKDGAGNVSDVAAAQIYLRFDMTPPEASLEINGGAETVTSTSVTLTVKAFDDGTPVERLKVRFSNDGQAWTAWESFAPQKAWTLASGEGSKVVYVQVKDENGNLRTAYAITNLVLTPGYSVTSPSGVTGTRVVNGQSISTRFVTDGRVLVNISAPGAASVRFSTDGVVWSDPEPVYSQRVITLPQGDGQREVFVRFDTGPVYVLEFTVDREPPLLDLSWLGGATVTANGSATLVAVASDAISAQSDLKYSYSVDGGTTWTAQAAYAKLVTVAFSGSGPKVVLFRVYDQAGNFAEKAIGIRN